MKGWRTTLASLGKDPGWSTWHVLNWILPYPCDLCKEERAAQHLGSICCSCWDKVKLLHPPLCTRCGIPVPRGMDEPLCGPCRLGPAEFDKAVAVGPYEGKLREIIHLYKYRGKRMLRKPLGDLMAPAAWRLARESDLTLVTAVPMHVSRLRQREFNQAEELAHLLAESLQLPCKLGLVEKVKTTQPQVELSGPERRKNVRGAFRIVRPREIPGQRILLVDDVMTTGATVAECARLLKKSGALKVCVLVLARAL